MLYKLIEILISAVLLIPVFAVLNRVRFHSTATTVSYFVFACYLAAVYLFVGMPTVQFLRFAPSLTLIPFLPMVADLRNTILNILLFVPLGTMLPFLWNQYRAPKGTLLFGFWLSVAIEVFQIFTYRATDINDILANTLGTALGYFLFRITSHIVPSAPKFAKAKNETAVLLLSVSIVMFFVQSYFAALYYSIT